MTAARRFEIAEEFAAMGLRDDARAMAQDSPVQLAALERCFHEMDGVQ